MKSKKIVYYDIDLITLAYKYLLSKGTHFTIVDVIDTCSRILKISERTNQYQRQIRFRFLNGRLEIYSQDLIKLLK